MPHWRTGRDGRILHSRASPIGSEALPGGWPKATSWVRSLISSQRCGSTIQSGIRVPLCPGYWRCGAGWTCAAPLVERRARPSARQAIASCREQRLRIGLVWLLPGLVLAQAVKSIPRSPPSRPRSPSLVALISEILKSIVCMATFCSSTAPPPYIGGNRHSLPPSPSRSSTSRGVSNCVHRWRQGSSSNRPIAPPRRMRYSPRHSKASRGRGRIWLRTGPYRLWARPWVGFIGASMFSMDPIPPTFRWSSRRSSR
jgi:hypothetical protein